MIVYLVVRLPWVMLSLFSVGLVALFIWWYIRIWKESKKSNQHKDVEFGFKQIEESKKKICFLEFILFISNFLLYSLICLHDGILSFLFAFFERVSNPHLCRTEKVVYGECSKNGVKAMDLDDSIYSPMKDVLSNSLDLACTLSLPATIVLLVLIL